ncbi:MAG TPA: APC family permease [Acetobacteraceae bacterium]|nr:APC family permease [Acetobacteraceae bacterium]
MSDSHVHYRLAKALGVLAITASAVAAEYGAGINFVSVQSLSVYPAVHGLVPLAMFVTGIAMLPKAYLFAAFSKVMPRAGSKHVWIARSLGMPAGFLITFVYWVTGPASMGVLGYAFGTFLGQAVMPISHAAGAALLTPVGHLICGLAAIWITFAVNAAGVKHYGTFVTILLFVIVVTALTITAFGFATAPDTFVASASAATGTKLATPVPPPPDSFFDFLSVCALFVFAYAGLGAGPALGGETAYAERNVPRGIYYGWIVALVLFSLVAMALFHAAPWWAVAGLIAAGKASYATAPGLIGLVAPKWVTVVLNLAVALIVGKTLAPALMVASRFCFAQAQDRLLPPIFAEVSRRKVPLPALWLCAFLGTLFLVQSVYFGWAMGVAVRSLAVLTMWIALAAGALNLRWHKRARDTAWARAILRQKLLVPASILSFVLAVPLFLSLAVVPKAPLVLQPLFQGAVVLGIGIAILLVADMRAKRRGESFAVIAARIPIE